MLIIRAIAILISGTLAWMVQNAYAHPPAIYMDHDHLLLVSAACTSFFFFCMTCTIPLSKQTWFQITCVVLGIAATGIMARLVHNGDLRSLSYINLFFLILAFGAWVSWFITDPPWREDAKPA